MSKQQTVALSRQDSEYDEAVQKERFSLRLSKVQENQLKALSERLGLDWANTVRLAITRLAQLEGLVDPPPTWTFGREDEEDIP